MIWRKGIPNKIMFCWVRWHAPLWMKHGPMAELAHFHPSHGFEFWSDEEDWHIEKMKLIDFEYVEILTPKEAEGEQIMEICHTLSGVSQARSKGIDYENIKVVVQEKESVFVKNLREWGKRSKPIMDLYFKGSK